MVWKDIMCGHRALRLVHAYCGPTCVLLCLLLVRLLLHCLWNMRSCKVASPGQADMSSDCVCLASSAVAHPAETKRGQRERNTQRLAKIMGESLTKKGCVSSSAKHTRQLQLLQRYSQTVATHSGIELHNGLPHNNVAGQRDSLPLVAISQLAAAAGYGLLQICSYTLSSPNQILRDR